ncbi:MYND-type zinc finger-containing chromatin reader Zmynd8-like [Sitodiplosis mosellana]|uniref:MYND-type zinc finger-containing chromatin reader Zmynd8-like n=1 Tax=Sitodiplosis mosellana TaxID=263140 RepID=UPI00244415A8|nr:MYND-type zinc finger-containing chromatin reader Zmynd8-like [Sitodiplosis mosellana]
MTSANHSHNNSGRHDKFCWNCHKKSSNISCPNCFRSFHEKCLKSTDAFRWNGKDKSLVSCTVCTVKEMSKEACVGMQGLLKMLKHTMVDILNNSDFRMFKDLSAWKTIANYCDDVVNPIDLDEIDRKICRELYNSFYAFLVDIDCIYHNCFVYYGDRHEFTKIARKMFEICTRETEAISSCAECYENKHLHPMEWRTMTCNKPHLVLWAKLSRSLNFWPAKKGFTHWPAKLISIDDNSFINLKVIFFESSEFVDISALECWVYSTKDATAFNQRFYNPNYIHFALKEVDLYGKNIEKKYGRFQSDLECIQFVREHLNDHMAAMFPDYDGSVEVMVPSQTPPIDDDIVDDRPAKRPRLSTDTAENPNDGSTKAVAILKKYMEFAEREMTELEKVNNSKAQQIMNELNRSKGALAVAHDVNRKLSSERDEAKQAVFKSKEVAAKSAELIKTMKEKIENLEENNGVYRQKMDEAIADKERVQKEKKIVEENLQKATRDHNDEKEALRTQISNEGLNNLLKLQKKLEKEHNEELDKLREQHEIELECEKNRISIENEKWKAEQQQKVNNWRKKIRATVDENFSF